MKACDALHYLKDNFQQSDCYNLDIEKKIASVYDMILPQLEDFALNDEFENNDKLLKLKELLTSILEPNPEKKVNTCNYFWWFF